MKNKDCFIITFLILFAISFFTWETFYQQNTLRLVPEVKIIKTEQTDILIIPKKEEVETVIKAYYYEYPYLKKDIIPVSKKVNDVSNIQINIYDPKIIDDIALYIKSKEQFRARAYRDYKQWSIGYGTKARYRWEVISKKEANIRLYKHIKKVILPTFKDIKFVSVDQLHSAIDLSYNIGHNGFKRNIVNKKGVIECQKIMKYTKVTKNGQLIYNEGLAKRRFENFLGCASMEVIK